MRRISTGCSNLDRSLDGGLSPGDLTLLYGEAETGKTTLAMQCAVNCARGGRKVLYIDCEGEFMPERLFQIASDDFGKASESIIITQPTTFIEQMQVVDNLSKYVGRQFGLVIFDTITSLYRTEILGKKETFVLNRELNRQVAMLAEFSQTLGLSILLISQVKNILKEAQFVPVASRVLMFWCDTIVGFRRAGRHGLIQAFVEKAIRKKTRLSFYIRIKENGINDFSP